MLSINIQNFRSLSDVRLNLAPGVTLVLGPNGTGKSSLAGALQYALTGQCEWTDKAGKGFASMIKHGATLASIDLVTEQNTIMRTLTPKASSIAMDTETGKDAQALLASVTPDPELLIAMLRSDGFIALPEKSQQDILFKLSGGSADADWFKERLDDDEKETLRDYLATLLTGSELAESLYKAAYGMRTEANRKYKELQAAADGEEHSSFTSRKALGDTQGLAPALEETVATLQKRIEEKAELVGKAKATVDQQDLIKRDLEQAKTNYNRALNELAQCPQPAKAYSDKDIKALEERQKQNQKVLDALVNQFHLANTAFELATAEVTAIDKMPAGHCVLSETLACPIDDKQRASIRNERMNALMDADLNLTTAITARDEAQATLQASIDVLDAVKLEKDQAGEFTAQKLKVDGLKAKCDELEKALPVAANLQLNALQSELANLRAELVTANGNLKRAQEAASVIERNATREAGIRIAHERAMLLDTLVKKLSPDGLPAQAMAGTIGKVISAINSVLSTISDFTLVIPAAEFELQINRLGDSLPTAVNHLSESEQLRVGAAIQVAFARLTNFNFVVVDAADRLDTPNRTALLKMLMKSGVQALVLATPLNGKRPQVPGLDVYDLVDGKLQAVVAEAVAA